MHKPKIWTNKKALNPLAIAIFLIVVLVSIVGIAIVYLSIEQRAGHAIQIQNVNFEETKTTIYVQNTGKGTVTLHSIQIDSDEFTISKENCTVSSEETTTVKETQTAKITINEGYQKQIRIKIICEDGTSIEEYDEPPKS
jgi:hypothetical protein